MQACRYYPLHCVVYLVLSLTIVLCLQIDQSRATSDTLPKYNVDREEVADSLYPGHSMADCTGIFHVLWYNPCQNGTSVLHLQQLLA